MIGADRVLGLGAGAAGLAAACALADRGIPVTVIEARGHIAGRAFTSTLWPDLPVDMGASWIHGVRGNPLTALADHLNLARKKTTYKRTMARDARGANIDFHAVVADAEHLVKSARKAANRADSDISLRDAVEESPAWKALSDARRRLIRLAIHTTIEHEYSGDWSRLSAWHFDDGDDFPGGDVVMTRGFGPVMSHLAQGLDLRLNEAVLAVAPTAGGVTVTTTRGQHTARRVIVTLPLGVLKAGCVAFADPLTPARQDAIDRLEVGLLNKCWLRFDWAFWPADIDWIGHLGPVSADCPGLWSEWTSFMRATGQPLLVGFNAAVPAEILETRDDQDTVASALAALRSMFGTDVPEPVGHQISRWRADPFARGAYSFQPVGTKSKTRRDLFGKDWDGRLVFAGEATSAKHPGTVHGALMSGQRAADLIG